MQNVGHERLLQMLIRGGADVNIKDNSGWTPLEKAAYYGNLLTGFIEKLLFVVYYLN